MDRITEVEVMATLREASAYDTIIRKYPYWMCRRFANKAATAAEGRVLDIGTGPGWVPIELSKKRPDLSITGIDKSREMLNIAHRNAHENDLTDRISFVYADARDLPFDDGYFDTVISSSFLHQIGDPVPVFIYYPESFNIYNIFNFG